MTGWDLIIVGASRGGLHAVETLLGGLAAGFPVPLLVVQHRAESTTDLLCDLLSRRTKLRVREVEDKMPIAGGTVYVAPPGYHVLVEDDHLALSTEAPESFSRPSIDVAMRSAADALGARAAGVILTGDLADGAAGLAAIRRRGGLAMVQDPDTAERRGMPGAAVAAARPQVVVALEEIAPLLVRLAEHGEPVA